MGSPGNDGSKLCPVLPGHHDRRYLYFRLEMGSNPFILLRDSVYWIMPLPCISILI